MLKKSLSIKSTLLITAVLFAVGFVKAAEPSYPGDFSQWNEVHYPEDAAKIKGEYDSLTKEYLPPEWRISKRNEGSPFPVLTWDGRGPRASRPKFVPKTDKFSRFQACRQVEDGWLIGFNHGEFGAALFWFSLDGLRNYFVSYVQVIEFFELEGQVYALEGLSHLDISTGSLIRIRRSEGNGHWQSQLVRKLPSSPNCVVALKDGRLLLTTNSSILTVDLKRSTVSTLLDEAPFPGLYPHNSVLSEDQSKLYIGLRFFVGEFDFKLRKLRLLFPPAPFMSQLPAWEAEVVASFKN